jgi:hypothetical protein
MAAAHTATPGRASATYSLEGDDTALRVAQMPIVLEKTALLEVQNRFGGSIGHRGDGGNALACRCFRGGDINAPWALCLESSALMGGRLIDRYTLQRLDPNAKIDQRCRRFGKGEGEIELPVALRLGVTEMQVREILSEPTASVVSHI